MFARFIEVLAVTAGVRMGHSSDIKTLLDDFAAFQPTFVLAVPRVFEKIYNSAEAKAEAGGKGKIFAGAAAAAVAWSEAQDAGERPVRPAGAARGVRQAGLRQAARGDGGQGRSTPSPAAHRSAPGSATSSAASGSSILEGYGLTETTAPATVNRPDEMRIGTVGLPLPGVDVRIADDGEICLRGINVFRGYHGNDTATAESIRDGWFHTGDIGELDDDGYLRITGRKKEILVTAGGKNVAPAVLEDRLRAHPLVSQCIVVGDRKPFIAALRHPRRGDVPRAGPANHGLDGVPFAAARTDERVIAEVQKAVDDANTAVSKAESIRKFAILDSDFTEETGHLTPSLKLKRNVVMRDFDDEVDALYGG